MACYVANKEGNQPRMNKAGSDTMMADVAYYVANKEGQQPRTNKAGSGTMITDIAC